MSAGRWSGVAERVIAWQASSGRHHLPWQQTRDPYRVWLSEIMLQQTQVSTVLDYYARFLAHFPAVGDLAAASQDEVLALWSGLGYYTRARNLHRCAQKIVSDFGGQFPPTAQALQTLPGIGRSTAGAIAAFCFSERVPILDANVRRVLTRVLGFAGDLASARNEQALWEHATALLPRENLHSAMPAYTQGLMDLGAAVCLPRQPQCGACPLNNVCAAFDEKAPQRYPVRTRKLVRRAEAWQLLVLKNEQDKVWLQKRPASGIWAGMHCVPAFEAGIPLHDCMEPLAQSPGHTVQALQPFTHVLTHRTLHLQPVLVTGALPERPMAEGEWLGADEWDAVGLPAPVRKLLEGTRSSLW